MIAKSYAQALFELAKEEKVLDLLPEEVATIAEIFKKEEGLQKIIQHPQISAKEKKEIWQQAFGGKINPLLLNFLFLLTDRKREAFLGEIAQELTKLIRAEKNITVVQVTTAIKLEEKQKESLKAKLLEKTGKEKIELEAKIDPSIIGGIILRIGNTLIDDSIAKHLNVLRRKSQEIQLKGIGVNG